MENHNNYRLYERFTKRILDFLLSLIIIIVLFPLLILSTVLVMIKLGRPVFFIQPRPGKNEKIFSLYKFRSMTNATDSSGKLLPDSERLSKFGKFIRKYSIDELPELINILKGDMSFVGPRPLSIYYLSHYDGVSKRRHEVRPGLTGLAQINGRNNLPWDDRFVLDVKYVNKVTFVTDIKIIFGTLFKVIKAADISVRGSSGVKDFGTYNILKEEGNIPIVSKKMTYSEIGSYFWLDYSEYKKSDQIDFLPVNYDATFTFSGRTAIDIALKDILKEKTVKNVYMPSYCCVSMIQSFVDRGIKVDFYTVSMSNGQIHYEIDEKKSCDIVLFMSYFGYKINESAIEKLLKLHKNGVIIIEDVTHSLFDEQNCHCFSDYYVSSLRKWFAMPSGGWVGKTKGFLSVKPDLDSNKTVYSKIDGMKKKYEYISKQMQDTKKKAEFLQIQSKFDNDLIHVDRMLKMDDLSYKILTDCDLSKIVNKRVSNAKYLKDNLSDLDGKVLTLPKINLCKTTPLFYPVFLKSEDRDALRKYLKERGVYCPVHWPEVMGAKNGIRANELSLVCDQRYSEKDMKAICELIHEWYEGIEK